MTYVDQPAIGTLDVPGARLHYEVRGQGPVLLLIPGGAADGAAFTGLAEVLADRYTVVTYDPRGLGRSALAEPPREVRAATQADDVHRLLSAVSPDPAFVFTSSGGGMAGLTLAVEHPEQVRALVVHEPPLTSLLPEAEEHRVYGEELYDVWRTKGTDPAIEKFLVDSGMGSGPDAEVFTQMMKEMRDNWAFFFGYLMKELGDFRPDIAALKRTPVRIVVAGGVRSKGQVAHRAAGALAGELGVKLVDFSGDHTGTPHDPGVFAEDLHNQLAKEGTSTEEKMYYMLLICGDASLAYEPNSTDDGGATEAWVQEMTERGIRRLGHPLHTASSATTVRVRDDQVLVSDGPFAETKEQMLGFDLIECADLDEAVEVAAKHPMARMGTVEVRPMWSD